MCAADALDFGQPVVQYALHMRGLLLDDLWCLAEGDARSVRQSVIKVTSQPQLPKTLGKLLCPCELLDESIDGCLRLTLFLRLGQHNQALEVHEFAHVELLLDGARATRNHILQLAKRRMKEMVTETET